MARTGAPPSSGPEPEVHAPRVLRAVASRLLGLVFVLVAISLVMFGLLNALPGNQAAIRIGPLPNFTPSERATELEGARAPARPRPPDLRAVRHLGRARGEGQLRPHDPGPAGVPARRWPCLANGRARARGTAARARLQRAALGVGVPLPMADLPLHDPGRYGGPARRASVLDRADPDRGLRHPGRLASRHRATSRSANRCRATSSTW